MSAALIRVLAIPELKALEIDGDDKRNAREETRPFIIGIGHIVDVELHEDDDYAVVRTTAPTHDLRVYGLQTLVSRLNKAGQLEWER